MVILAQSCVRFGPVYTEGYAPQEEELFKWTPTTYPQLDQIGHAIDPYQKLFNTILKWQKAEKRLMDGSFLDLNAEDTQVSFSMALR